MRASFNTALALSATAVAIIGACAFSRAEDVSLTEIARGRYLTNAADCVACHTSAHGQPFAGGRPIETPFGTIYSPNITPDRQTGIGEWTEEDFYRALHSGISPDGKRLYPAFPYPYFTRLTREDVRAIHAYLDTLSPVKNQRPASELTWPLNYRVLMRGWDWIFFDEGTFVRDPRKSDAWNRGAYLVEGAGHCGGCHTPKNIAGADKTDQALTGGQLQNWFAPKLASDARNGLGKWSVEDIAEYLKTGRNRYSGATGLMAEVVANSTSKLDKEDLHAIAVYLKDVAAAESEAPDAPKQALMEAGAAIFADTCSACHQSDGTGVPRMFPPLAHNANVQSADPTSIIRVILQGAQTVPTDERPTPSTMPAFDWRLTDSEVAAVATYVRNHWGNSAPAVNADRVKSLREELQAVTH